MFPEGRADVHHGCWARPGSSPFLETFRFSGRAIAGWLSAPPTTLTHLGMIYASFHCDLSSTSPPPGLKFGFPPKKVGGLGNEDVDKTKARSKSFLEVEKLF